MIRMSRKDAGFTLIELLVVIAIIGILAGVVTAQVGSSRARARDARRVADIKSVQTSVEAYNDANGTYPTTGGVWRNDCGNPTDWVPSIRPTYLQALPIDPAQNCGMVRTYAYNSNGNDYKIMAHQPENCNDTRYRQLVDPARNCWAWALFTSGAQGW